jgi:DNA-binding winged helix-turn-helix (wHTH) protein/TolB-like protein
MTESEPKTSRNLDPSGRTPPGKACVQFGPFALNTWRGCLLRGDDEVHLRPQTYEVLRCLVENDGRLLSKDELIERVWQGRAVTDGSLGKCVEEIRDALGPRARSYVRNVRGRGYLFDSRGDKSDRDERGDIAAPVAPAPAAAAEAPPATARGARTFRVGVLLLAATLTTLAVIAARAPSAPPGSSPARATRISVRSLAVLPFRETTDGPDGSLELGMADAVIMRLGVVDGLIVRPLSAIRPYATPARESTSIGRELEVDAVLEGNIQRTDTRVRVTARLLQVRDGRQLWADVFDGPFSDIFAVQDAIAERVARALAFELTGEQLRHVAKRYTDNIAAYRHYLKGRQHALALTRQELFAAREAFERAIAEDSGYALAYAGLADVYTNLVPRGLVGAVEGRATAEKMARRALALDAGLAEAHAAIGQVLVYAAPFDFEAGDQALRRAIQLNPNLSIAHHFLGVSLLEQGRLDGALEEWQIASQLDPLSPRIARMLAYTYLLKRDHRRALELLRGARDLGPSFTIFPEIEIYLEAGAVEEAEAEVANAPPERLQEPVLLYSRAILSAARGRRDDALRIVQSLEKASPPNAVPAHLIAGIHAMLGEEDAATAWLSRGVDAGTNPMFYKDSPIWSRLRGRAPFASVLRRMGIVEQS